MNTGIAQLVALAAHGNAALHGALNSEALDSSPLFRHVSTLRMVLEPDASTPSVPTVSEWLAGFRKRGITAFRFVRLSGGEGSISDHDRTAFANGEQSAVAAVTAQRQMELWVPDWESGEGTTGWELTYRGWRAGSWNDRWLGPPVSEATTELRDTLSEIADFAGGQGLEHWADNFIAARAQLSESDPPSMGLLPAIGYGRPARQLLSAALSSWVFGGMGSWNDTGPRDSDQYPRYEALTAQLYDTLMNGLVAAANAFDPTIR